MIFYKFIFIFVIFLQCFQKILPNDEVPLDRETRKNLWRMFRHLYEDLSKQNQDNQEINCDEQIREQGKNLISTFESMAKKLDNSSTEPVFSREMVGIFEQIDAYLTNVHETLRTHLMAMEAYNSEFRLKRAMEMEKEAVKCTLKGQQMLDQQQLNGQPVLPFLNELLLCSIGTTLEEISLFHLLSNSEAQKKYNDHFLRNFYTMKDLTIQKNNAEANAEQIPSCGHGFQGACTVSMMACSICCIICDKDTSSRDSTRRYPLLENDACYFLGAFLCPFCSIFTAIGSFLYAIPNEAVQGIRRKLAQKEIDSLTKKINELGKEIGEQKQKQLLLEYKPQNERGKQQLLENVQRRPVAGRDKLRLEGPGQQIARDRDHYRSKKDQRKHYLNVPHGEGTSAGQSKNSD